MDNIFAILDISDYKSYSYILLTSFTSSYVGVKLNLFIFALDNNRSSLPTDLFILFLREVRGLLLLSLELFLSKIF